MKGFTELVIGAVTFPIWLLAVARSLYVLREQAPESPDLVAPPSPGSAETRRG